MFMESSEEFLRIKSLVPDQVKRANTYTTFHIEQ